MSRLLGIVATGLLLLSASDFVMVACIEDIEGDNVLVRCALDCIES